MLAACKAAFSGLGQAGGASRGGPGTGGRCAPGDKQVEAFVRALCEAQLEQVSAHVYESRSLLVLPLKGHPSRSTAWHLAAAGAGGARGGGGGGGGRLLELLLQLYGQLGFPPRGLPYLLNLPNKRGQTCLHAAAARGNVAAVRLLLSHGCDLLRADKSGRTALHHACAAASDECARVLLTAAEAEDAAAEAAVGATAATEQSESTAVAAAAGTGAAGGAPPSLTLSCPSSTSTSPTAAGRTAAAPAPAAGVLPGQLGAAPSVLSKLVTAADASGLTALHFAVASNSLPLTRLLLAAGASYTCQTTCDNLEASLPCNAGSTSLHVAAMKGHYDLAMMVLRFHTSLSSEVQVAVWRPGRSPSRRTTDPRAIPDRRGSTAAALAASRGFSDLAALLRLDTPLAHVVHGAAVGPDGREVVPPAMFVCPITQEVLRDPVVASDGFTYERAAISKWISAGKLTSPMTNLPFTSRSLFPNNVLRSAIKEWRQQHQLPDPDVPAARQRTTGRGLAALGLIVGGRVGSDGGGRAAAGVGAVAGDSFIAHLRAHGL